MLVHIGGVTGGCRFVRGLLGVLRLAVHGNRVTGRRYYPDHECGREGQSQHDSNGYYGARSQCPARQGPKGSNEGPPNDHLCREHDHIEADRRDAAVAGCEQGDLNDCCCDRCQQRAEKCAGDDGQVHVIAEQRNGDAHRDDHECSYDRHHGNAAVCIESAPHRPAADDDPCGRQEYASQPDPPGEYAIGQVNVRQVLPLSHGWATPQDTTSHVGSLFSILMMYSQMLIASE